MIPILKQMGAIKPPEFLSLTAFKERHDIVNRFGDTGFTSIVEQPTLSAQPYVPIVGIRVSQLGAIRIGLGSSKAGLAYSRTGEDFLIGGEDASAYEIKITNNAETGFAGTVSTSPSGVGSFLALTEDREWEWRRDSSSGIGQAIFDFTIEIREIADNSNTVSHANVFMRAWIIL